MTRGKAPGSLSRCPLPAAPALVRNRRRGTSLPSDCSAMSGLKEAAVRLLEEARLTSGSVNVYGTPRRLTLVISGLALRQASAKKEVMGPSKAVGLIRRGNPRRPRLDSPLGKVCLLSASRYDEPPKVTICSP